jgi:predicted CoA-binding protein
VVTGMATKASIDEFLSHKNLALLRLSSAVKLMAGRLDDELRPKGYEISVVYLADGDPGPHLDSVKGKVEGLIIATPKSECLLAANEAVAAKMPRVWIQRACESPEGIALLEKNGIPVVCEECVMMYAEPVKSVHSFHRWLTKLFGKLAV